MNITLGELVIIAKGRKASKIVTAEQPLALPYLQIDAVRSRKASMHVIDQQGVIAHPSDIVIVWDGANSGEVGTGLFGYIGSTLAVLRLDGEIVCSDFLFYFLRSNFEYLNRNTTGATIPHVDRRILESIPVMLPPLAEQQRIADILARADRLRQLRRYALQLSDTYLQAVFLRMFGDPVTNPMGFKVVKLNSVCKRITDGTHQPPQWSDDGYPFLFVSNVVDGELNFETKKSISHQTWQDLTNRCPIERNDILYTIVGSYGNAALVRTDRPFAFQRHIAHIKPDHSQIDAEFLLGMLQSPGVREQADQQARGVAQKTLNLRELKEFLILLPPVDTQRRYVGLRHNFERLRSQQREALRQADHLFDTLLHRAFRGEL